MSNRSPGHYMPRKKDKLTYAFLSTLPSLRPPSTDELAKRAALRAEIESMSLYGLTTTADRAEISERIKHRTMWQSLGQSHKRKSTNG